MAILRRRLLALVAGLAVAGPAACARPPAGDPWEVLHAREPAAALLDRSEPLLDRGVLLYSGGGACPWVALAQFDRGRLVADEVVVKACDASIEAGLSVRTGARGRPDLAVFTAVATETCEAPPPEQTPGGRAFEACDLEVSHAVDRWRYRPARRRWIRERAR